MWASYHVVCRQCATIQPFFGGMAAHIGAMLHEHDCEVHRL